MHRRLTLSIAMLAIGASLLAATATAGSSASSGPAATSGPAQKGGTFRFSLDTDIDYVDPALAYYVYSWQIEYATSSLLMSYPDAPAPRGSRLVPEVARIRRRDADPAGRARSARHRPGYELAEAVLGSASFCLTTACRAARRDSL